jgi:hypothetical protein
MKNSRYTLFFIYFNVLIFNSCSTYKNKVGAKEGWYVITTEKSKHTPLEYLTMRLHYAEFPYDTVSLSMITVNGVDLTTEGSQKEVRLANGLYKIEALAFSFYPIQVTIRKKRNYDIFIDFYLKSTTDYMNVKK